MQAEQHEVVIPERQIGEQMLNLNRVSNKPQGHHCGYCESNGSYSWGLTKQMMHPLTYQILAERGWRRCGTYYYKPDIKQSCCKLWTHRLDINKFKIKKDQKKTVRHVVDWLLEKIGQQSKKNQLNKTNPKKQTAQKMIQEKSPQQKNKQEKIVLEIPQKWNQLSSITSNLINQIIQKRKEQFFSLFQKNLQTNQSKKQFNSKIDPSKVKCFISQASADSDFYTNHLMILFGINKKLFKKSYGSVEFIKDIGSFLLTQIKQSFKNDVQVQIQRSGYVLFTQFSSFKLQRKMKKLLIFQKEKNITQKLSKPKNENRMEQQQIKKKQKKQQQNKKKEIDQKRKKANKLQFSVSSTQICFGPLLIQIVPAEVTTESWRMYQRYCTQIHQKPEKQKSSYSGFLCQKALKYITTFKQNKSGKQYTPSWQQDSEQKQLSQVKGKITKLLGCYHMKYYIQKQLFGVGVVDILPEGLSSVYFFYQPKYKDYRLGVFSSLVQIQYVRWLSLTFPEFKYYYMGFYIQNSQKMNYKGNYQPFDLLCPITYQFVQCNEQLRQLIDKIQKKQIKQVQLSQSNNKINDMNFTMDIGVYINQKVKIKYQGMVLNLKDLNPRILIPVLGMLRDMVQVWGKFIFQTFTFTF